MNYESKLLVHPIIKYRRRWEGGRDRGSTFCYFLANYVELNSLVDDGDKVTQLMDRDLLPGGGTMVVAVGERFIPFSFSFDFCFLCPRFSFDSTQTGNCRCFLVSHKTLMAGREAKRGNCSKWLLLFFLLLPSRMNEGRSRRRCG